MEFTCPVCGTVYDPKEFSFSWFENHVNTCIDSTELAHGKGQLKPARRRDHQRSDTDKGRKFRSGLQQQNLDRALSMSGIGRLTTYHSSLPSSSTEIDAIDVLDGAETAALYSRATGWAARCRNVEDSGGIRQSVAPGSESGFVYLVVEKCMLIEFKDDKCDPSTGKGFDLHGAFASIVEGHDRLLEIAISELHVGGSKKEKLLYRFSDSGLASDFQNSIMLQPVIESVARRFVC